MPGLPGSRLNESVCAGRPRCFGFTRQKFSCDEDSINPVRGREKNQARRFGGVVKPIPRGAENEDEDQADHYVVLPRSAGKVPEQKTFAKPRSRNGRMPRSLTHPFSLPSALTTPF